MHDEITEMKAGQIRYEKKITSQIEAFGRNIEDQNMVMANHTGMVEGFQQQLDVTRESIVKMKDLLMETVAEMQSKLTLSHTELNQMFK